jgi:hypothetical protein
MVQFDYTFYKFRSCRPMVAAVLTAMAPGPALTRESYLGGHSRTGNRAVALSVADRRRPIHFFRSIPTRWSEVLTGRQKKPRGADFLLNSLRNCCNVTSLVTRRLAFRASYAATLNSFVGVAYTKNQRNSRISNVPKLYQTRAKTNDVLSQ